MAKSFEELVNKIFGKKRQFLSDVQTAPLSEEQLKAVSTSSVTLKPIQLMVGTAQSVGKQREHNEDSIFALNSILADGNIELPFGIFIVADGMGGHMHGEVASGVAIRAFSQFVLSKLYMPFLGIVPQSPSESLQEMMEKGMQEAQRRSSNERQGEERL